MGYLKTHPFAVEAYFKESVVLTFALPKEKLKLLIPACLELDTFQDKWAFVAIAMVDTKALRPKGFPKFLGNDFFLSGYRIFVKYQDVRGKRLRGLYILKSETDQLKMKWLGNLFSHYKYTKIDINYKETPGIKTISSQKSAFHVCIKSNVDTVKIPENSPFKEWKEARRFAGPLPFTFSFDEENNQVTIIEGVRQYWKPSPLSIKDYHFDFLQQDNFKGAVLASAFVVRDIPYYWKKGKIELWKKN